MSLRCASISSSAGSLCLARRRRWRERPRARPANSVHKAAAAGEAEGPDVASAKAAVMARMYPITAGREDAAETKKEEAREEEKEEKKKKRRRTK